MSRSAKVVAALEVDKLTERQARGEHKRLAVKVIDPRGNEVLRVHKLGAEYN